MADGATNLETALARVRQQIADVLANPLRPDYSVDGQSVPRVSYYRNLIEMESLILEAMLRAQGPYELNIQAEA